MKKIILIFICISMLVCMPACKKNDEASKESKGIIPESVSLHKTDVLRGKKLGCSIVFKGDEWCSTLADALEALAHYYGAELTCEDGDQNDETQSKQINNMVVSNCDMVFVDPVSPNGSTEALNNAYNAGIPILIFDSEWVETEEKAFTCVTWDQYETGVITANYFLDYIRRNGKQNCSIVELAIAVSVHCQDRYRGLHDTLAKADDCNISFIGPFDTQGNREIAYNIISAMSIPYDFVISDIDNGAMGAAASLTTRAKKDIKVFSMGGYGDEPFEMLRDNDDNYIACLNVDAWKLAELIIDNAIKYFNGEEVPKQTLLEPVIVDKDNVGKYWNFD